MARVICLVTKLIIKFLRAPFYIIVRPYFLTFRFVDDVTAKPRKKLSAAIVFVRVFSKWLLYVEGILKYLVSVGCFTIFTCVVILSIVFFFSRSVFLYPNKGYIIIRKDVIREHAVLLATWGVRGQFSGFCIPALSIFSPLSALHITLCSFQKQNLFVLTISVAHWIIYLV